MYSSSMANVKLRPLATLQLVVCFMISKAFLKEIDSKLDLLEEETMTIPAEHRAYPDLDISGDIGAPLMKKIAPPGKQYEPNNNEVWPFMRSESSQIKTINVKCEKNLMKVNIEFDRPFHGLIFSKGHYSDPKCVHLPAGTGQLHANFEIYLGSCGMTSSEKSGNPTTSLGLYIENTIIIQYDPQVQEIWDQARKLRCTWYDFYEKAVTFRPFNVDMLDAVTANFLGDNIQCWMQIQVGKGPWASEVAGIVKIGQTMTMVLAIKDEENKFDMLVRNCIAHDGKHQPIQLVDEYGCIVRPKIMSKFQKVKNFGHSATVVSYAYFQAFKFPDSMNVHFQCVIQVCRFECPQPTCDTDSSSDYMVTKESTIEGDSRKFLNRMGELTRGISHTNGSAYHLAASQRHPMSTNLTETDYIRGTSGTPRSLNLNRLRRKRSTAKQAASQRTDINTQKVIQVVAPGDVAFSLPLSTNEASNEEVHRQANLSNMVCMPSTGLAAGLVLLVLLLLLTSLVTIFLVIRLKSVSRLSQKALSYGQCTKHPKATCSCKAAMVTASPAYYVPVSALSLANVS